MDQPPRDSLYRRLKYAVRFKDRCRLLARLPFRAAEAVRYAFVRPTRDKRFVIVSSQRNAGDAARRCLDSVYAQDYDRRLVRHIYIDDVSSDDTRAIVERWLAEHPDHNVDYIATTERAGGCANNLRGFRMAEPGSIVFELNGDDWLPDARTLDFLDRVYCDEDVWTTYNTLRLSDGRLPTQFRPIPARVIRANAFRDHVWMSTAPHTFRAELFSHVDETSLIDPDTGEYWANADDLALYFAMLELAGSHSRHIHRVMYIYNYREYSETRKDGAGQLDRADRIRRAPRYRPLEQLTPKA